MEKPIEKISDGLREVQTILAEFLSYELHQTNPRILEGAELKTLIIEFQRYKRDYLTRDEDYLYSLSSLILAYRNIVSHDKVKQDSMAKDPLFVASVLDSIRMFIDYLVPVINKHRNRRKIAPLMKPLFKYRMCQPEDSCSEVVPEKGWKTKSSDYVRLPVSPFDLSKLQHSHFHKDQYLKAFRELNYFNPGEKILIVRTRGDIFAFYKDRRGYTGDWKEEHILANDNSSVEVDRIMVVHFYEGEASKKAHVYLADYHEHAARTEYVKTRYRYKFKNIASCGDIEEDFVDNYESAIVITIPVAWDENH